MRKHADSDRSTTPFKAEDYKYSKDEFLTTGHDDHGQSVRLFFRCPPTLERSLEIVRDGRRFPYQTVSDIIRHAVIRHVEWLHRMEPDMPRHFLSGLNAINEICRDAEMLSQIQQTFAKVDSLVESHLGKGEVLEAQHLISMARGQLAKIPDSRWKREFSERFTRKYARHTGMGAGPANGNGSGSVTPSPTPIIEFPALPANSRLFSTDGEEDGEDLDPTTDETDTETDS